MMMKIEKKIHHPFFDDILQGKKSFELRLADWNCKVGDILVLREWDSKHEVYTGRVIEKEVTYVLKTKDFRFFSKEDIEKYGFQVLSLK